MFTLVRSIIFIFALLSANFTNAEGSLGVLQPFEVTVSPQNESYLWVKFTIAQDYHLYQSKIKITNTDSSKVKIGTPIMPDPIILANVDQDKSRIYEHNLAIQVPITSFADGKLDINITYQGCKGTTLCLPEQSISEQIDLKTGKTLLIGNNFQKSSNNVVTNDQISLTSNTDEIVSYFGNSFGLVIGSFFVLGLLIAFTPCVFPLLPILITLIAGKNISQRRSFVLAFSYILGGAVIYALAGLFAASIGHSLSNIFQTWWISSLLAILFLAFALSMFGFYDLQLPAAIQQKLNSTLNTKSGGSIIGSFIIGGLSNLILSPCVTAPLAGALVYISTTGNQLLGGLALFALGIGSGIPLLIIAVFGKKFLPKSGNWMLITKQVLGLVMLAMTGYMISKVLIGFDDVIIIIWSVISIIILGRNSKFLSTPKVAKIALGLVLIVAVGVYKYTSDIKMRNVDEKFITVTTVSELNQQLAIAKMKNLPVVLDYYANWCSACKEMDLRTFSNPEIQKQFTKYVMIRVDVTYNSADVQALQNRYDIIALPSLVLLDPNGNVIPQFKSYGYINSNDLMTKLTNFDQTIDKLNCSQSEKC